MLVNLTWSSGVLVLFGGLLLVIGSILEFILGNTFSCVVFGQLGGLSSLGNGSAEHRILTRCRRILLGFWCYYDPSLQLSGYVIQPSLLRFISDSRLH